MTASLGALLPKHSVGYDACPTLGELNAQLNSERWEEVSQCLACSSARIKRFARIRNIIYHRCISCGFTFANPIPPDDVLSRFYNSPFYNNYRRLEAARIRTHPYFSVSFSDLRRLAGWLNIDRSASILDLGCGPGSLIALLRDEFGYRNVKGVELNAVSARVAQQWYGLEVASDIGELRAMQFDLLILVEVIEHIPNPRKFLSLASELLKPGGALFITTDSVRNIPARYFPSYSGHYTGPSHVSLFTERAMVECLSQSGFRIERLETDSSSEVLGSVISSPFYKLDYLSPQSDDDFDDRLYVPTMLGRMLGLQPCRTLPRPVRALRRIDAMLGGVAARMRTSPSSNHLFVLARKETP